ncbi:MAG: GNAT family N-acetyltransferase [Dehalococcoidia bacterium]
MYKGTTIRNFDWSDTSNVVSFLNNSSGNTGKGKEISCNLFSQIHRLPGTNPETDCYIAEDDEKNILGFLNMVIERPINRSVAMQTVSRSSSYSEIINLFSAKAIEYTKNKSIQTLHTQIGKTENEWKSNLVSAGWKPVKEYWILECKGENLNTLESPKIPSNFEVVPLNAKADIEEFTNVHNLSFSTHWGFSPNTVEEIKQRVMMERSGEKGILLIRSQSNIVGYNWTLFANNNNDPIGWISMTGVEPDYRGKRLGRSIVLMGMHDLIKRGVDCIELEVDSENLRARELYLNLGFTKSSESIWFEINLSG